MGEDTKNEVVEAPTVTKMAVYGLWLGLAGQTAFGLMLTAWPLLLAIGIGAIPVGVIAFFIFMISRRKNWARITYAVVYGIASLLSIPTGFTGPGGIITFLKYNLQFGIPRAILEAIILCAVIMLFLPASNTWFRQRSPAPATSEAG